MKRYFSLLPEARCICLDTCSTVCLSFDLRILLWELHESKKKKKKKKKKRIIHRLLADSESSIITASVSTDSRKCWR